MAKTTEELRRLLADLETDQVEGKESLKSGDVKDRICQAICAFSNDLPDHRTTGVVFVGAADDGHTVGLAVDDRLLLELADLRGQGRTCHRP
ncbi:MAG TPA: RNA-binding domain-containing protein [Mycobacteriales bacterium]